MIPLYRLFHFLYYHGEDNWIPVGIDMLFQNLPDEINDYIPLFKFLFENIQNYSDEQIRQLSEGLLTSALLTPLGSLDPKNNYFRLFFMS